MFENMKYIEAPVGRFAPSPSGRMHLGNVYTAVLSWLSVKSRGGRWILRIEDLDPQRSRMEYARQIEEDLLWLGLEWDEGGVEGVGGHGPYCQSQRREFYEQAFNKISSKGLIYPCTCRRADILAAQAPHASDGRVVYTGKCRPSAYPPFSVDTNTPAAQRLYVPDEDIHFVDGVCGPQTVNLAQHCGDFIIRRADGVYSYQLAVVVDDAAMGVTEVLRGDDLLLSSGQQIYLYRLLGLKAPSYFHVPLVCNEAGQRLSKRDGSMSMEALRERLSPEDVLGEVGRLSGVRVDAGPCCLEELLAAYSMQRQG